jgi:hypothetical protein
MPINVAVAGSINEAQNSNNFTLFLNRRTYEGYDLRRFAVGKARTPNH